MGGGTASMGLHSRAVSTAWRPVILVLALQFVGIQPALDLAHALGITMLEGEGYGLAVGLGSGEVKLLDMTYVYSVFATNGVQNCTPRPRRWAGDSLREMDPVIIRKVEAQDGTVLEEFTGPESRQALPAPHAHLVTSILADNAARTPMFGPASALVVGGRPAAAKTGTTDDLRDNWTVGYAPDLVAGVWIGNVDNAAMTADAFGSSSAAPIWNAFMAAALDGSEVHDFPMPPGLVLAPVCPATGMSPGGAGCAGAYHELFVQGAVPPPALASGGQDLISDRRPAAAVTPAKPSPPPPPAPPESEKAKGNGKRR